MRRRSSVCFLETPLLYRKACRRKPSPLPKDPDLAAQNRELSGPVRDTPPYRAIPFRDSIAEGGIAPICLVFIGYRASIAEIPF